MRKYFEKSLFEMKIYILEEKQKSIFNDYENIFDLKNKNDY